MAEIVKIDKDVDEQRLVSIIIPAHNEEKWIASCSKSVLRAPYPDK